MESNPPEQMTIVFMMRIPCFDRVGCDRYFLRAF
jgi:hypothetical protein